MPQGKAAYRLLVVDDEPGICRFLQGLLTGEGYECLVAGSAEEGMKACAAGKPDLLVLDINLPDDNGIEFCRRFKGRLEFRHIPVLLMTGEGMTVENKIDGLEAGAAGYILKPFPPEEMVSQVKAILEVSARPGA